MQISKDVVKALTPEAKKLAAMAKVKLAKLAHQAAVMKAQEVKEANIKAAAIKAAKTEEEVQVSSPGVKQAMQISKDVVKALTPEAKKLAAMAKPRVKQAMQISKDVVKALTPEAK